MTDTQLNLATAAAIATIDEPASFVLDEQSNTQVIRLADGWLNTTTEIVYPFSSYTGMFYTRQWEMRQAAKAALEILSFEDGAAEESEPFEWVTPEGVFTFN